MLADPAFCDLAYTIGVASLAANEKQIWHLTKLYWYTVEFGVVKEDGEIKAFGAGVCAFFSNRLLSLYDERGVGFFSNRLFRYLAVLESHAYNMLLSCNVLLFREIVISLFMLHKCKAAGLPSDQL
jgi:Biopterin-dependent aromatic amino acid hydroxylase